MAHLLEHMMFKGTPTIGTKDFAKEKELSAKLDRLYKKLSKAKQQTEKQKIISEIAETEKKISLLVDSEAMNRIFEESGAGFFNAWTWQDGTMYAEDMPKNTFELWARLNGERVTHPVFRYFYKEREVVIEERRMRVENSPFGLLYYNLITTAFQKHPYRIPTIGKVEDLRNLFRDDLKDFYNRFYRSDRMIISLAGDLTVNEIRPILNKYFGLVPMGKREQERFPEEPKQKKQRKKIIFFDAQPQLLIGFHKPTYPDRDAYLFNLLATIFTGGRSSIFYKELVKKRKIASVIRASSDWPGLRYNNLFVFYAQTAGDTRIEDLSKAIFELIEKSKDLIDEKTLNRAKRLEKASMIWDISSNSGIAENLAYWEGFFGSWKKFFDYLDVITSAQIDELQLLIDRYLKKENSTVIILKKKKHDEEK